MNLTSEELYNFRCMSLTEQTSHVKKLDLNTGIKANKKPKAEVKELLFNTGIVRVTQQFLLLQQKNTYAKI